MRTGVRIVPARVKAKRVEHAIVKAGVRVVLNKVLAQRARALIGSRKGRRAANSINGRNVAGVEPEPILEQRSTEFEPGLQDVTLVLLGDVVLGCTIQPGGLVQACCRIQAQATGGAESSEAAGTARRVA